MGTLEVITVKVWDNLDAWWEGEIVQNARRQFCDWYDRISISLIGELRNILATHCGVRGLYWAE